MYPVLFQIGNLEIRSYGVGRAFISFGSLAGHQGSQSTNRSDGENEGK